MRRLSLALALACIAATVTAGSAAGKNGGVMCVLTTQMTAQNETTGSTSTARGHTQIKVWNNGTITYKVQIFNPNHETFVAGHIHRAATGVPGPIVVPLFAGTTTQSHIKLAGTATPNTGTTGAAICQSPSSYYANFHTTAFGGGAIRGQLG